MSVPLAGDSGPTYRVVTPVAARYQNNRKSAFIIISIALAIVLVGSCVSVVLFVRYTGKFREMDRSHESLSWQRGPGPMQNVTESTTYKNPAYGLTLTLPGDWRPSRRPTPYLCHLVAFTRFNALLEADFPILTPTIEDDAALVVKRYAGSPGLTLKSEQAMTVNGYPAHLLHLTSSRNVDLDMVMVKKWPADYVLSVAGPSDDFYDWNMVRAALPQALQLQ
ncbi:MAG TPA: hypothetical protein VMD78_03615 [Candidatus Baltobacteraceae bacterium]|nr:hypothetical protein [Candidatus Baltobacteraceae bacterium]